MKKALLIMFALALLGFAPEARAFERGVTPYGDFCPKCSNYGNPKPRSRVGHAKAIASMDAYFGHKGLTVGNARGMGRFIKVDVFRHGKRVDRIIFDRRTGRIRSIY